MLKVGTASQRLRKFPDLRKEQEEDIATVGPLLDKATITSSLRLRKF